MGFGYGFSWAFDAIQKGFDVFAESWDAFMTGGLNPLQWLEAQSDGSSPITWDDLVS